jgi:peptidoglycan hydrolase CwlO-like protein
MRFERPLVYGMRKSIFSAILCIVTLISCKRDYVCKCTTTDTSGSIPTTTAESATFTATKRDADEKCKAVESTVGTLKTTCKVEQK